MDSWEHGKNKVQVDALFAFQQRHGKLVLFDPKERVISQSIVRTELIAHLVGLRYASWMEDLFQGAKELISAIEVDRFGNIYLVPRREVVKDHPAAMSLYDHSVHDFLHLIAPFASQFRSSVYVCILPEPNDAPTYKGRIKDTMAITNLTHRCWGRSFKAGYISSVRYCDMDGELSLLPTQRFRDECKSFADLKINLYLLRRKTDARLWLRVLDPEHELDSRYIRSLCITKKMADTTVSWAANEKEATWLKILEAGKVIERWPLVREGTYRPSGSSVRVQPEIHPLWAFEDT